MPGFGDAPENPVDPGQRLPVVSDITEISLADIAVSALAVTVIQPQKGDEARLKIPFLAGPIDLGFKGD